MTKLNKYMISADIEGISGVATNSHANSKEPHYNQARRYMTHNVNAVIKGILAADASAEIIVRDAHGSSLNLDLETLHPKASLVQGWGSITNMVASIDETFNGLFLVGYHGGGDNLNAVLAHTFSSSITKFEINGIKNNEIGIAALTAAQYNVPLAFLSSDDISIAEAKECFSKFEITPETVTVKKSLARDSVQSLSLQKAEELLVDGAKKATERLRAGSLGAISFDNKQISAELFLNNTSYYKSNFAGLKYLLSHDKTYNFNDEKLSLKFENNSLSELMPRIYLILNTIYSLKSV